MASKKETALKTASVLAFERKLDPSDALFYSGQWNQRANSSAWAPVTLREKSVRGTISNRMKGGSVDDAKLDAQIEKPNLQTVDVASLPPGADTLLVRFSLRVLAGAGMPSSCNSAPYQAKLQAAVNAYMQEHGFAPLARRYAQNLANGRFLWRNRMGAEAVEVKVEHAVDGNAAATWSFNALDWSMRDFSAPTGAQGDIDGLAGLLAEGLAGSRHVLLQVSAWVRLGAGQEVYPSQELILDKGTSKKSKTLYDVQGVAGMHAQKLGNALRTVDDWHPDAASLGPIAAEPYGSVTTLGKACRRPAEGTDFYSLLDGWLLKDKVPEAADQHYVMSILIRGGVFGDADKE